MKESHQQGGVTKNRFALNFKSYSLAIVVHILLLGIIMFNFLWNPTKKIKLGGSEVQPIQAQVIDETLLNQELDKIKEKEELKKHEELEKQQKLEDLEQQALLKEQEIKELEEEKKRKAEEVVKQQELDEEKARQAEKTGLAEEAKLKELALKKKKEEEEIKELAKKKKAEQAEKNRKLEEEKKKKEELAKKKSEEEKKRKQIELETQLAEEQAKSQAAALFAQYVGPIRNKVTNSWIRPGTIRPGARAKVLVRVSPRGDVLTARIQAGSGDPIFDRSVINAVYKASPLPIPDDPRLYPHYRDFVFNFDPPG